jgi:RNA polymerase sigma-54 factor
VNQRLTLQQKLGQGLAMTPQLRQAIRLLQFSNLELAHYLEEQLSENPFLERGDAPSEGGDDFNASETAPDQRGPANQDSDLQRQDPQNSEAQNSEPGAQAFQSSENQDRSDSSGELELSASAGLAAAEWETDPSDFAAFYEDEGRSYGAGFSERSGVQQWDRPYDPAEPERSDLRAHVAQQISLEFHQPEERLLALHLTELLNDSGYILAEEADQTAERLGCSKDFLEEVLARLRRLEPAGLFARSLAECLAAQLVERNRFDPAIACLLDNLPLVAKGEIRRLSRLCALAEEEVMEMIAEVRALDPKPGEAFSSAPAEAVIPDILLRQLADGAWHLELNQEVLPRVLVNRSYHRQLRARTGKKKDQEFLLEHFQSASWLVRALDQRATTILKVAEEIVRRQDAFLRHGIAHLKPLSRRELAEDLDYHESTISRVTSNKFMQTPRGTFALKAFFTNALSGSDGEAHSAAAVRDRIGTLIAAEDPAKVLSDEAIAKRLRTEGVEIARRTVAKYREAIGLPTSAQRRRRNRQAGAA